MARVEQGALVVFAQALLAGAGLDADKAAATASVLVEGDMIGHDTHGVGLLPWYLDELAAGRMAGAGTYEVVADRGASFVWNGNRLPGAWLLTEALDLACDRAREFGVVTGVIGNAHHTCALFAYMRRVTERGLIVQMNVSNPAASRVAPYGGTRPVLTPNPIAAGFLRICALAEQKKLKLAPHFAMEIHLHLAAAYEFEPWVEHFDWLDPLFNERLENRNGRMIVPNRPGLGFTLSEQALAWKRAEAEFGKRP